MAGLLDEFVGALTLTDEDRASLRKRRGFFDPLIDSLKFKSCGLYIRDICGRFSDTDLKRHKIMAENGQINKQLLRPNILIPYISSKGEIYKIRPHKLGFKGDPVALYSEFTFNKESQDLIITEGEFKSAAAFQY